MPSWDELTRTSMYQRMDPEAKQGMAEDYFKSTVMTHPAFQARSPEQQARIYQNFSKKYFAPKEEDWGKRAGRWLHEKTDPYEFGYVAPKFVSGLTAGWIPEPEEAATKQRGFGEDVLGGIAQMLGMVTSLAPVGLPLGAATKVAGLGRLAQSVVGGALPFAAYEGASRLEAPTYQGGEVIPEAPSRGKAALHGAGIGAILGGAGHGLEYIAKRFSPQVKAVMDKVAQFGEKSLTKQEYATLAAANTMKAGTLGAGLGAYETPGGLEEKAKGALAGALVFGGAHGVTEIPKFRRAKGIIPEPEEVPPGEMQGPPEFIGPQAEYNTGPSSLDQWMRQWRQEDQWRQAEQDYQDYSGMKETGMGETYPLPGMYGRNYPYKIDYKEVPTVKPTGETVPQPYQMDLLKWGFTEGRRREVAAERRAADNLAIQEGYDAGTLQQGELPFERPAPSTKWWKMGGVAAVPPEGGQEAGQLDLFKAKPPVAEKPAVRPYELEPGEVRTTMMRPGWFPRERGQPDIDEMIANYQAEQYGREAQGPWPASAIPPREAEQMALPGTERGIWRPAGTTERVPTGARVPYRERTEMEAADEEFAAKYDRSQRELTPDELDKAHRLYRSKYLTDKPFRELGPREAALAVEEYKRQNLTPVSRPSQPYLQYADPTGETPLSNTIAPMAKEGISTARQDLDSKRLQWKLGKGGFQVVLQKRLDNIEEKYQTAMEKANRKKGFWKANAIKTAEKNKKEAIAEARQPLYNNIENDFIKMYKEGHITAEELKLAKEGQQGIYERWSEANSAEKARQSALQLADLVPVEGGMAPPAQYTEEGKLESIGEGSSKFYNAEPRRTPYSGPEPATPESRRTKSLEEWDYAESGREAAEEQMVPGEYPEREINRGIWESGNENVLERKAQDQQELDAIRSIVKEHKEISDYVETLTTEDVDEARIIRNVYQRMKSDREVSKATPESYIKRQRPEFKEMLEEFVDSRRNAKGATPASLLKKYGIPKPEVNYDIPPEERERRGPYYDASRALNGIKDLMMKEEKADKPLGPITLEEVRSYVVKEKVAELIKENVPETTEAASDFEKYPPAPVPLDANMQKHLEEIITSIYGVRGEKGTAGQTPGLMFTGGGKARADLEEMIKEYTPEGYDNLVEQLKKLEQEDLKDLGISTTITTMEKYRETMHARDLADLQKEYGDPKALLAGAQHTPRVESAKQSTLKMKSKLKKPIFSGDFQKIKQAMYDIIIDSPDVDLERLWRMKSMVLQLARERSIDKRYTREQYDIINAMFKLGGQMAVVRADVARLLHGRNSTKPENIAAMKEHRLYLIKTQEALRKLAKGEMVASEALVGYRPTSAGSKVFDILGKMDLEMEAVDRGEMVEGKEFDIDLTGLEQSPEAQMARDFRDHIAAEKGWQVENLASLYKTVIDRMIPRKVKGSTEKTTRDLPTDEHPLIQKFIDSVEEIRLRNDKDPEQYMSSMIRKVRNQLERDAEAARKERAAQAPQRKEMSYYASGDMGKLFDAARRGDIQEVEGNELMNAFIREAKKPENVDKIQRDAITNTYRKLFNEEIKKRQLEATGVDEITRMAEMTDAEIEAIAKRLAMEGEEGIPEPTIDEPVRVETKEPSGTEPKPSQLVWVRNQMGLAYKEVSAGKPFPEHLAKMFPKEMVDFFTQKVKDGIDKSTLGKAMTEMWKQKFSKGELDFQEGTPKVTGTGPKIISGGQTGADRGGLIGAREAGLETGGYAPKGWKTEKGSEPELAKYGLKEHTTQDYLARTYRNVDESDGTALFGDITKGGTRATFLYAAKQKKPYIVNPTAEQLKKFVDEKGIKTLNIAGTRGSKDPGLEASVAAAVKGAFTEGVKPKEYTPDQSRAREEFLTNQVRWAVKKISANEPIPAAVKETLGPEYVKVLTETLKTAGPEQRSSVVKAMVELLKNQTGGVEVARSQAEDVIAARFQILGGKIENAFKGAVEIGKSIWAETKGTLASFSQKLKEVLGAPFFERLRPRLTEIFKAVKNEKGAIDLEAELKLRQVSDDIKKLKDEYAPLTAAEKKILREVKHKAKIEEIMTTVEEFKRMKEMEDGTADLDAAQNWIDQFISKRVTFENVPTDDLTWRDKWKPIYWIGKGKEKFKEFINLRNSAFESRNVSEFEQDKMIREATAIVDKKPEEFFNLPKAMKDKILDRIREDDASTRVNSKGIEIDSKISTAEDLQAAGFTPREIAHYYGIKHATDKAWTRAHMAAVVNTLLGTKPLRKIFDSDGRDYRNERWFQTLFNEHVYGPATSTWKSFMEKAQTHLSEPDLKKMENFMNVMQNTEAYKIKVPNRDEHGRIQFTKEGKIRYKKLSIDAAVRDLQGYLGGRVYFPRVRGSGRFYAKVVLVPKGFKGNMKETEEQGETVWRANTEGSVLRMKEERHLRALRYEGSRWMAENTKGKYNPETHELRLVHGEEIPKPGYLFGGIQKEAMERYINAVMESKELKQTPDEIKAEFMDTMMNAMYEDMYARSGFKKHWIKRKEFKGSTGDDMAIEGYHTKDADKIYLNYFRNTADYIGKTYFKDRAFEALKEIKNQPKLAQLGSDFIQHVLSSKTNVDSVVGKLKMGIFFGYMGANLRPALVNLTQNLVAGTGILSAKIAESAGYRETHGGKGRSKMWSGGLEAEKFYIQATKDAFKINHLAHEFLKDGKSLPSDPKLKREVLLLADLVVRGNVRDLYLKQLTTEMEEVTQKSLRKILHKATRLFSQAEKANRIIAGLARARVFDHYEMKTLSKELEAKGFKGEELQDRLDRARLDAAQQFINEVHYVPGEVNLPPALLGRHPAASVGRGAYIFRNFLHNFVASQVHYAKNSADGKLALDVMFRSLAYLGAIGGLAGLPLIDDMAEVAEQMTGTPYREQVKDFTDNMLGDELGKGLRYGILSALGGPTLSGSIHIGPPTSLKEIPDSLVGVLGGVENKIENGFEALKYHDWTRAIESFAPEALANPIKAARLATEGATLISGTKLYGPGGKQIKINPAEALLQFFGFRPTSVAEAQDVARVAQNVEERMRSRKKTISAMFKKAYDSGDPERVEKIMEKVNVFNENVSKYGGAIPFITSNEIKRYIKGPKQKKFLAYLYSNTELEQQNIDEASDEE